MKKLLKENKQYIILFIFFSIIMFLSPICGDDWGNYLEGVQGFKHMIGQAIGMYFSWEGRFISRVLINILTCNKVIWNIINSIALLSIIYLIVKIIKPKNKKMIFLLSTLTILLMNIYTFSQVVVWIAGNITYLFVIPLLLYYIYSLFNNKYNNIILIPLNIIIPMFVEHTGIILVLINIYFIIREYIKTKKINKLLLLYLIISIISILSMLLSPGSRIRSKQENIEFNNLSFINKILYNLPNYILYTFFINTYLNIISTISNIYLIKKIKNKTTRIISYIYMIPLPIIISILYLISAFKSNSTYQYNELITVYYIIYSLITLLLMIKTKNEKVIFFYILGMTTNGIMLLSPTWGYRTSFATYIFLTISYLIIIDKYIKENKLINYTLLSITILSSIFYLILYTSIHLQYKDNLKRIETNKNSNIIEIVSYPGFVNCNINPTNEYHMKRFKEYYKINDNTEVRIINNNWKYLIIYKKI